jgi:hypothetical protein
VLALDFDQAKNVALLVAGGCVIGAILAIWILSSIVQKVLVALLFLLLGFAAWSQHEALQDCASKVQASIEIVSSGIDTVTGTSVPTAPPTDILSEVANLDTSCTFFGTDVSIP